MSTSEKINILVTGCKGQLGSELHSLAPQYENFHFTYIDIDELNLLDEAAIKDYFQHRQFHVIINCAAYTAVDPAEDNKQIAFQVNSEAVRILAEISRKNKIRLIHISTDYIFDGKGYEPIKETANPSPLSVYGQSKLDGEKHVTTLLSDAYIIRTSWVYSTFAKNFVKTISTVATQRAELKVVADQIGSPTYANDLAAAILTIIHSVFVKKIDQPGIYNFSNDGATSWYDLAHFIIRYYNIPCEVKPISTEEYNAKAIRPKYSLLDKKKIKEVFGITPPHWHDSLVKCLQKLPHPVTPSTK